MAPYLLLVYLTCSPIPDPAGGTVFFCPGGVTVAGPSADPGPSARPDGPEKPPETRPDPEREKRLAQWREEWRKHVASLPKVETRFTRMVVYRDGVVTYATYRNRTKVALRVSLIIEPLQLRGIPLKDSGGAEWSLPTPLKFHYQWVPDDVENTALLKPGEGLELRLVDKVEGPTLRPAKGGVPPARARKPAELRYEIDWPSRFLPKDLEGASIEIHRVGAGAVKVEWKDEDLPKRMRTRVERRLAPGAKAVQPSKSGG